MKVPKPGLQLSFMVWGWRGAWMTWLQPCTPSYPREVWMTPLWARGVSPSGTSPFSSFTSSLVAVIIFFLAILVACCVYWGQLHHRPSGQLLLHSHYTGSKGAEEGISVCVWVGACGCACVCVSVWLHMWLRLCLCLSVTNQHLSLCLFAQTRMSARSLEAQCVVPGAVRTPSAPTDASKTASLVMREKTPQTVVSGQTAYS